MWRPLIAMLVAVAIAIISAIVEPTDALANCPTACDCDDDTLVVTCGEGHLDVLPIALNPSIKRLVIKNNKIKMIDSSLQFYAELLFLDLSYNHLFNIPVKTFGYQKKLQELHLNHNKIGSINNRTFVGLESLTVLNLRGNFIDELDRNVFSALVKLEELNLGQNRIARIATGAFDGLTSLRVLYIDDNTLTSVPSNAFPPLKAIAELFLGLNSFTTLPPGSFEALTALSKLDLRGAALANISTDSFKGLEQLRSLDLSDNRLHRIPTRELSTLGRLEELSLGQNDFEVIPEGAFAGLMNLRRLDITGSLKLRKVESGAFATNTNLESLTLASNKALVEVQEGALSGLPHLRHVILRDNALVTLAEGLFPWSELHTLDLAENPLVCDCRLLWLRQLLVGRSNGSQPPGGVICAAPERLREEPLRAISPELLGCMHADPRRQAIIGALVVGAAATITALALILYRCRRRIREVLKGGWGNSALGRKEREYQKTFSAEEDYMSRHSHPCSLAVHPTLSGYSHHHPGLRPIPVTEL
ncbi:leucine-rich repeat and immunoglobulin-like domain containing-NOGO receptor-interacting protein 4 [Phlebotomus papatasi]|nr:leucine-rich repeat and immunoglobulin-like domain containing-NOGO receptor-interacting protein 4 [Phlebotomus papatasi]XP_055706050.1 leucine-rich repeat and immunoglobulin-like domain containing-NOGO receptor-interacting protein 4 [Phlebotomus papatasi]